LIELISSLPQERYACHLLVKQHDAYYIEKIKGTLCSFVSLEKEKFHIFDFLTVADHINRIQPDIVCSWTNITSHFALLARVITRHPYKIINCCIRNAPIRLSVVLRIERFLYSFYTCVVANSKSGLIAYGQEGKNGRHVLYNGLDMGRVPSCSQTEARKTLGLGQGTIIVVMIASCTELKDHETLLKAFAEVSKKTEVACYHLLIVGDGERRSSLENMTYELDIFSAVTFMGRRDDVEVILRASDMSVLSSTAWFGEGISNSILEALACGTPVIASDSPGTREVLNDENNGYIFPSGDHIQLAEKIQILGGNRDIRQRFTERGKLTIEKKFSITGMITSFEKIVESCDKF